MHDHTPTDRPDAQLAADAGDDHQDHRQDHHQDDGAGPGSGADTDAATDRGPWIPAPFGAVPTLPDPDPTDRERARCRYPTAAVPLDGPVPDPYHHARTDVTVTVPEWALAAVVDRFDHGPTPDTTTVEDDLLEYAQPRLHFETPDGRDAVDVVRERADLEGDR